MNAESGNLPSQFIADLGELMWEKDGWRVNVEFNGCIVPFVLVCDLREPTREEKLRVLDFANTARGTLEQLRKLELRWRPWLAKEMAVCASKEISEETMQGNLTHVEEFSASLVLEAIRLHDNGFPYQQPIKSRGNGELQYRDASGKFLPLPFDNITIYFRSTGNEGTHRVFATGFTL